MPILNEAADEGFYRRVVIIPFNRKITKEEENAFDKSKILTQEAIDFLANISLREYQKIENKRIWANNDENERIINQYRMMNNNVFEFVESDDCRDLVYDNKYKVKKTIFYKCYTVWCNNRELRAFPRLQFYQKVLETGAYQECSLAGYDCFKLVQDNTFKTESSSNNEK